jgi:hypothetical protein
MYGSPVVQAGEEFHRVGQECVLKEQRMIPGDAKERIGEVEIIGLE